MAGMAAFMESHTSIAALLRADRGDQLVVARLLETYRPYLRLLARTSVDRALKGKADPSDVVQEAMLRAAKNFTGFRGHSEGELVAWLRQLLVQSIIDLTRRYQTASRRVTRERSLNQMIDQSSAALETFGRKAQSNADSLPSGAVAGVLVANALAQLDNDDREVISLRNFERLEWSQVGERMGRTGEAARKLWTRAILRLRPIIEATL
ncbi:MAG: sigma-70 family RNA polymerase sigma factor [Planctomycetia bacterium]|nr:sigma-70 family RNA polymerase sigma factor [Planctomycetia bacterium]